MQQNIEQSIEQSIEQNTENKYYRASINKIPRDQSKLRSSSIPFFFNVDFFKNEVPVAKESLIRCDKCKAYLNPFVEIINPGYKWKCNLCETVNEVSIPFQMTERRVCENTSNPFVNCSFNKAFFTREELRNEIFEIEAPDSFNLITPEAPVMCFVIDVSAEAQNLNILQGVLSCVREALKGTDCDPRTKVAMMFFNESVYVLNTDMTFSIINGEIPLILSERVLFSIRSDDALFNGNHNSSSFFNVDLSKIEKYFEDKRSPNMNYLLALKACAHAFRSATVFSFVSTIPNWGEGKIEQSTSLVCKNPTYKEVAESFVKKNICCNLFVMTRGSVELSSIKVPTQFTGGQIIHYSNFDGSDAVSTAKFFCDLCDYLNRESNVGAVCRIRSNEGVVLKSVYGNFYQKGPDLLAYSNFNPVHSINFTIQLFSDVKTALFIQIAMARVVKNGRKLIRVANVCIPVGDGSFYDSCDAYSIAHSLSLESFYFESKKKLGGKENLENRLGEIWREIKTNHGQVPPNLYNLPTYVLSLMKSIPFRPDLATPTDFRVYYTHILSNYCSRIVDLMIYPVLLNVLSENVNPLPLSLQYIDQSGLYILDTGVNVIFYIGKTCDKAVIDSVFDKVESGPFVFSSKENELSKYVSEVIVFLTGGRSIKPRYVLANGQVTSVYNDIFFSYMYEDSAYQLAGSVEFRNSLESKK